MKTMKTAFLNEHSKCPLMLTKKKKLNVNIPVYNCANMGMLGYFGMFSETNMLDQSH